MDLETLYALYLSRSGDDSSTIEKVEQFDTYELLITKKDGRRYLYDMLVQATRYLPKDKKDISDIDEKEYSVEFGYRLVARMRDKGMTLETLSEKTGISVSTLYRYLNGASIPNFYKVIQISKALDCDINEFLKIPI